LTSAPADIRCQARLGGPGGEHVRAANGSYETGERQELRDSHRLHRRVT